MTEIQRINGGWRRLGDVAAENIRELRQCIRRNVIGSVPARTPHSKTIDHNMKRTAT